ncbi:response regulator transcription factor [Prosthecomicrobium sp. N25]|uniref:response regulator transcription factor n=1 Tax=Prosthecomicrobium sp. N25 TaxID=3129254 RepID=UPI0030785357
MSLIETALIETPRTEAPRLPLAAAASPRDPLAALTVQQRKVIELVAQGLLNKQIAHRLGLSASTVKAHISAAYRALGVTSRVGAVLALSAAGQIRQA